MPFGQMQGTAGETMNWEMGFAACALTLGLCCFGIVCAGLEWGLRRWGR